MDASNTPSWRKEYALRDHLGSTRLLFADKNGNGIVEVTSDPATNEIIQENHYYPFGLSYGGSHWMNDAARDNGYKYNGKELNEDWGLGWYDYGARWYMPDLGRWGKVDPLAEKRNWLTIYNYVQNNPLTLGDPSGALDSPIFDRDGNFLGTDSEGFKGEIIIMDADKYAARLKDTQNPLDHKQVMAWADKSPYVQTLDNYVANNNFELTDKGMSNRQFLSNIFTNLLSAANEAGVITYKTSKLQGGKIKIGIGGGTDAANYAQADDKDIITATINPMSYRELREGYFSGTQSLHHLGNSGDAINILGVHEPLHRQYPGSEGHPFIDPIVLNPQTNPAISLASPEYKAKVERRIQRNKE